MSKFRKKPNKLTVTLIIVAVLLVALLAGMLIFLGGSGEEPAEPTVPPTEAAGTEAPTDPTEPTETIPVETEPVMLAHMAELYAKNQDVAGWVRIDGTKIDYPFVYTPEDYEKYLYMDLDGNYSYAGTVIMDQRCTDEPESTNVLLHGHNMKNGTMFKSLMNYVNKSYWEEHPTIYYSNLYEEREYMIIAAFYDQVYKKTDTCFKFYEFIEPQSEEEFNEGIAYFKDRAEYDTGMTAEYGDRLLMLSTCSYHLSGADGRFVVVAREMNKQAD